MKQETKNDDENINPDENLDENVTNRSETVELEEGPDVPTASEGTEEEVEKSDFDKLKDELAEFKDKYLRLYSEFDNFRKRTSKEKLDLIQNANEQLLVALLPIVDDFERASKVSVENHDVEGYKLIQDKFNKSMEKSGITSMKVDVGDNFDPDFHEAITQIPAPNEKLKGKIVDVVEKGYLLNEKVIRYAKVVVGN
jgi:molecular chaperone GrpE